MKTKSGFSLMEIIVVLCIVGLGAAMMLPNFMNTSERTEAQMAETNLLAIMAGEQKHFEDTGVYYTNPSGDPSPTADIDANLHLSLSDTFMYTCFPAATYSCTAGDGTDTLTLTPGGQPPVSCVPAGSCPANL